MAIKTWDCFYWSAVIMIQQIKELLKHVKWPLIFPVRSCFTVLQMGKIQSLCQCWCPNAKPAPGKGAGRPRGSKLHFYGDSDKPRNLFSSSLRGRYKQSVLVTMFLRLCPYQKVSSISLKGPFSPPFTSETQLEINIHRLKWRWATHSLLPSKDPMWDHSRAVLLDGVIVDHCAAASFCRWRPLYPCWTAHPQAQHPSAAPSQAVLLAPNVMSGTAPRLSRAPQIHSAPALQTHGFLPSC